MHCSFLLSTHCNSVVTMACLIHGQETHKQCTWNIFLCVLTLYSSEDNVPTSLAIKTEIIIKIPLTRKHSRHNESFIFLVLAKMFWEKMWNKSKTRGSFLSVDHTNIKIKAFLLINRPQAVPKGVSNTGGGRLKVWHIMTRRRMGMTKSPTEIFDIWFFNYIWGTSEGFLIARNCSIHRKSCYKSEL